MTLPTMADDKSKPAPTETGAGKQKDDNIDDLGRRPDGGEHDQPVKPEAPKPRKGEPQWNPDHPSG